MDTSFNVIKPLGTKVVGTYRAQVAFGLFDKPYSKRDFLRMCYRGMMTAAAES